MNLPNRPIYGRRRVERYANSATYEMVLRANAGRARGLGHGQILFIKSDSRTHTQGLIRRRQSDGEAGTCWSTNPEVLKMQLYVTK
ncbi:hypothetical protein [Cellulomonas shaoxiangyii]|uniref:Uncharacterized protein n=1 Tax=Cellulomonas shaoxiangyii TaxID=2566013 RepID=A0A4P7SNB3_9CELL|nr:hypothetical protein [Cellulomonas shaoxiangyii]QCB94756.1 hypothetical protein E5225_15520 [Cellulomonas shaoxiangyii]TGY86486.1 hypothetical protein E5226_01545 [Cellulomonas shaoxiangyii]